MGGSDRSPLLLEAIVRSAVGALRHRSWLIRSRADRTMRNESFHDMTRGRCDGSLLKYMTKPMDHLADWCPARLCGLRCPPAAWKDPGFIGAGWISGFGQLNRGEVTTIDTSSGRPPRHLGVVQHGHRAHPRQPRRRTAAIRCATPPTWPPPAPWFSLESRPAVPPPPGRPPATRPPPARCPRPTGCSFTSRKSPIETRFPESPPQS